MNYQNLVSVLSAEAEGLCMISCSTSSNNCLLKRCACTLNDFICWYVYAVFDLETILRPP